MLKQLLLIDSVCKIFFKIKNLMIIAAFPYALREVSFAACPDYCLSCLVNIYKCDTEKCARGFGVSTVTGNCIREYNYTIFNRVASLASIAPVGRHLCMSLVFGCVANR